PQLLKPGPFKVTFVTDSEYGIMSYRKYDPHSIPKVVFDLLRYFDGRRDTDKILKVIDEEQDVVLDGDMIRKLVDLEILVPVEAGNSG
ncbi:MAG: hypothetical protein L0191_01230, partial [Acidobacteria bacterium]|nr:hypothetical protein [Acidobacteriota bacterium]